MGSTCQAPTPPHPFLLALPCPSAYPLRAKSTLLSSCMKCDTKCFSSTPHILASMNPPTPGKQDGKTSSMAHRYNLASLHNYPLLSQCWAASARTGPQARSAMRAGGGQAPPTMHGRQTDLFDQREVTSDAVSVA